MWHEGTIRIPEKDGKTDIYYCAKVYDAGSQYGINRGRISKLMLRENRSGKIIYNYDRGLDVPPQTDAAEKALAILLKEYE